MTDDVRGAILARCVELERIAKAAQAAHPGRWRAEAARWDGDRRDIECDGPCVAGATDDMYGATGAEAAAHIVAWDPPAALDAVAGAREMCEIHTPNQAAAQEASEKIYYGRPVSPSCETCQEAGAPYDGASVDWPCPTLLATAKMIGAKFT